MSKKNSNVILKSGFKNYGELSNIYLNFKKKLNLFKKRNFLDLPGVISGIFLAFYSLFRFFIEFFRVPDEQLGFIIFNLTMGQIISFIFFIAGIYLIMTKYEIQEKS